MNEERQARYRLTVKIEEDRLESRENREPYITWVTIAEFERIFATPLVVQRAFNAAVQEAIQP